MNSSITFRVTIKHENLPGLMTSQYTTAQIGHILPNTEQYFRRVQAVLLFVMYYLLVGDYLCTLYGGLWGGKSTWDLI